MFSGVCWLLRLAGVFSLAVGLVFALLELLLKVLALGNIASLLSALAASSAGIIAWIVTAIALVL